MKLYHKVFKNRLDLSTYLENQEFGKLKQVYVIFICDYDPFGYDRVLYTIKNRCLEESDMDYEDESETIVLYTRGKIGEISEELRGFLKYMENTNQKNAVNEELKDIQRMVDVVKRDGEVSLRYMKSFEHDKIMYEQGVEQGRQAEMKNTEKEKQKVRELEEVVKKLQAQLKNGKISGI